MSKNSFNQYYRVPDVNIWNGRKNPSNITTPQYLYQVVTPADLRNNGFTGEARNTTQFALIGYDYYKGIVDNQGNASDKSQGGPDIIRSELGRLTLPDTAKNVKIFDTGDIHCRLDGGEAPDNSTTICQHHLAWAISHALSADMFPIVIGGGHDLTYGVYKGARDYVGPEKKVGIINFDAHLDLRQKIHSKPNSGTSFVQVFEDEQRRDTGFHYLPIGIQAASNPPELRKRAEEYGVHPVMLEDFRSTSGAKTAIKQFMSEVDYVYITVDLDGFSSTYGAATSAANPVGFTDHAVLDSLRYIFKQSRYKNMANVIACDVAEFNPGVITHAPGREPELISGQDIKKTAQLGAKLIHAMMAYHLE